MPNLAEAFPEGPTLIEEEFVEEFYEIPLADRNSTEVETSQQQHSDQQDKPTSELPQSRPSDEL